MQSGAGRPSACSATTDRRGARGGRRAGHRDVGPGKDRGKGGRAGGTAPGQSSPISGMTSPGETSLRTHPRRGIRTPDAASPQAQLRTTLLEAGRPARRRRGDGRPGGTLEGSASAGGLAGPTTPLEFPSADDDAPGAFPHEVDLFDHRWRCSPSTAPPGGCLGAGPGAPVRSRPGREGCSRRASWGAPSTPAGYREE